jgi:tetratricopeptide (TPR) repeat protein
VSDRLDRSEARRQLRALLAGEARPRAGVVAGLVGAGSPWPPAWELARGKDWRRLQGLRRQMDLGREPVLTVVLLAQACAATGDAAGAEQVLRQALATQPREVVLLKELAEVLERQGPSRLGEAIGCYRALRALQPSAGVALGKALVKAGQGAEGEAVLRDLARKQSRNPEMHYYLANALAERRKPAEAEAEAAYRKALALQPGWALAHSNLGSVLREQKRPAEAEAACRQALALRPDYALGHNNLGVALLDLKRPAEAEAACRRALALQPDYATAYNNLGLALLDQKRPAEAEAACRQAIALRPDFALAYTTLGNALQDLKRPAEAEAAHRKRPAARRSPSSRTSPRRTSTSASRSGSRPSGRGPWPR